MAAMPFAVIGSEKDVKTSDGRIVKGRQYSWGVAEVENEDHCDFKKLRSILIRTHMLDLIHTTDDVEWTQFALDCGYYDQAHFIHDFRLFSGMTPGEYVTMATPHLNHVPLK